MNREVMPQPAPQFTQSVADSLAYWRERTSRLDEETIGRLDAERENLYRVVEFGLKLSQTQVEAAVVALQSFDLVERRGYWQEWIPVMVESIAHCTEEVLPLKCRLLNRLGVLHRLNRQLPAAITTHEEAEILAQRLGDAQALAEAHYHLSADHLSQRDYEAAERYGTMALAEFTRLEDTTRWLAATFNTLGEIARHRGESAVAEQRLSQAVALWRTLDRPLRLARALNDLALTLWTAKFDEAVQCFTEAAELLAPTTNELDKILIQLNLGTLHFHRQQWAEAEAAFRRADSPYLRQSGHVYYQGTTATNLGSVLLKQGRLPEAESYLRGAVPLWRQASDNVMLANTLGTLGETLAAQGQMAAAIALYDEAITLLIQHPQDAWARQVLEKITGQRQTLSDS